jgi:hypothetical protein
MHGRRNLQKSAHRYGRQSLEGGKGEEEGGGGRGEGGGGSAFTGKLTGQLKEKKPFEVK